LLVIVTCFSVFFLPDWLWWRERKCPQLINVGSTNVKLELGRGLGKRRVERHIFIEISLSSW
jgi:hypothetical protein